MSDDATMALAAADALANTLRALVAEQHDEIVRLRAEVERLRAENAELQDGQILNRWPLHKMLSAERALVAEQHDEIVRLRTAGDALAEDLGDNPWAHLLIAAWQEARRER